MTKKMKIIVLRENCLVVNGLMDILLIKNNRECKMKFHNIVLLMELKMIKVKIAVFKKI
jgi:hypothetical protein